MTAENTTLNGGVSVTGDLLVPGTPTVRINGNASHAGMQDGTGNALPSDYSITLNGGTALGHIIRRSDAIALPLVSPPRQPGGTRMVVLDGAGQAPGDFATLRDLTLGSNVGQVTVPPGAYGRFEAKSGSGFTLGVAGASTPAVYDLQSLILNAGSSLQVVGPVVLNLGGDFSPKTNLGVAAHPGWLKLRLASGGLLLDGHVTAYAALEAPGGALALGGSAQFTGSVVADRLEMNGGPVLRLLILNQPPTVDLVVPAEGAVLPDSVDVAFFASAGDADGSVVRVEFYDGSTKLGEAAATATSGAVFRFAARLAAGPHALTARAIDDAGAATDSTVRRIAVNPGPLSLPIVADFEPAEGYQPGLLHGQKGWAATSGVEVVAVLTGDSRQEASIAGGPLPETLSGTFKADGLSPVFVDFLAKPVAGSEPAMSVIFATAAARIALVGTAPTAQLHGATGTTAWQNLGFDVPVNGSAQSVDWLRLSVREDYGSKTWDLYANGRMIAADLAFVDPAVGAFGWFTTIGHPSGRTNFDDFYAGPENPIAADADRDGLDDAWETAHALNPALNDRNGDLDADGLTNIQEYVLGTNPNNTDTDGDGLPDSQERALGTNPGNADSDGDGLPDGWEQSHGLNPLSAADAALDSDGDGISNLAEFTAGTDPADFYNGVLPQMASLVGPVGELGPGDTLQLRVTDAAGTPLVNAPVTFIAQTGGHQLAATIDGPAANEVTVRTGADGVAKAYVRGGSN